MKNEFWKHQLELFMCYFTFITIFLALTIAGMIMTINDISFWPFLVICFILLLLTILYVIFEKRLLSKVVFSEVGIKWKRFNKEILFISWDEITDIRKIPRSRTLSWLSFVAGDKQIYVDLTQKMYNAIMEVCPYDSIKIMINDIDCFKWFHRNK